MDHPQFGRRRFIRTASGALALGAAGWLIPQRLLCAAPESLLGALGGVMDESELRAKAKQAMEAAIAAGAQYADVRVEFVRVLMIPTSRLLINATMGIRAAVGGSWGFAGGEDLAADAVAALARLAVMRAKAGGAKVAASLELAPAPVIKDGHWQTPVVIDPFTIPAGDQLELVLEARKEVDKLKLEGLRLRDYQLGMSWNRSDRVFASTEGSLISQRTYASGAIGHATASPKNDHTFWIEQHCEDLFVGGYGYEALQEVDLKKSWVAAAQEAAKLVSNPIKSVDVGRYDVVLSGEVMAQLAVDTVGRALELDRARGDKANSAGTSYAMPPLDILGRYALGSPLLTISADRSRPRAGATVGWDEEGVKPEEFTLVRDGVIVDYLTTRPTAPTIAAWYKQQNQPLRSHGCAVGSGSNNPVLQLPNLTLHPGKARAAVEDLIAGVRRGFYVTEATGSMDQQCLNGQYRVLQAREIRSGRLGSLVRDMALQFSTPQLWKSLKALGGKDSAASHAVQVGSVIHHVRWIDISAVPGYFQGMNIINTGKQG